MNAATQQIEIHIQLSPEKKRQPLQILRLLTLRKMVCLFLVLLVFGDIYREAHSALFMQWTRLIFPRFFVAI